MDWDHQLGIVAVSKHYMWHGHPLILAMLTFLHFARQLFFTLSSFDVLIFNPCKVSYNLFSKASF